MDEIETALERRTGLDQSFLKGGNGSDGVYGDSGADVLMSGDGTDVLDGGDGNDNIMGENGDDLIFGNNGDDLLIGGAGDDFIDGGEGYDIATYAGQRSQYSFGRDYRTGNLLVQSPATTKEGLDVLTGVEELMFSGGSILYTDLLTEYDLLSKSPLDITGDGLVNGSDSLLLMRHMLGTFPGESIKQGLPETIDLPAATARINQIFSESFSLGGALKLDIDGDSRISAFSDGLILTNYIHQQASPQVNSWEAPSFIRTERPLDDIQQHLRGLVGF